MASIERTAYPQFKSNPVVRELVAAYTPNEAEINFVFSQVRQPTHRLTLAILLEASQRLGYSSRSTACHPRWSATFAAR
jgi:hypothetical protein